MALVISRYGTCLPPEESKPKNRLCANRVIPNCQPLGGDSRLVVCVVVPKTRSGLKIKLLPAKRAFGVASACCLPRWYPRPRSFFSSLQTQAAFDNPFTERHSFRNFASLLGSASTVSFALFGEQAFADRKPQQPKKHPVRLSFLSLFSASRLANPLRSHAGETMERRRRGNHKTLGPSASSSEIGCESLIAVKHQGNTSS